MSRGRCRRALAVAAATSLKLFPHVVMAAPSVSIPGPFFVSPIPVLEALEPAFLSVFPSDDDKPVPVDPTGPADDDYAYVTGPSEAPSNVNDGSNSSDKTKEPIPTSTPITSEEGPDPGSRRNKWGASNATGNSITPTGTDARLSSSSSSSPYLEEIVREQNGQPTADVTRLPEGTEVHKACPHGYIMTGKECVATEVFSPTSLCPLGATESGGQCTIFTPATRKCPPRFNYNDIADVCIAYETEPAEPVCRKGGRFDAMTAQCVVELRSTPRCQEGAVRNRSTGNCELVVEKQPRCPDDFEIVYHVGPGGPVSPIGQAGDVTCVKKEYAQPTPFCATANLTLSGDGTFCHGTINRSPQCPPQFQMIEGECVQQVPIRWSDCPSPNYITLGEDQCEATFELPATPLCPSGFEPEINSAVPGPIQCRREADLPAECPVGALRSDTRDGVCFSELPPIFICENGGELIGGSQCRYEQIQPPKLGCGPDFELSSDGKCVGADLFEPQLVCSIGRLASEGTCIVERKNEAILSCPPGYQPTKAHKCVREISYDCSETVTKIECTGGPVSGLNGSLNGNGPLPTRHALNWNLGGDDSGNNSGQWEDVPDRLNVRSTRQAEGRQPQQLAGWSDSDFLEDVLGFDGDDAYDEPDGFLGLDQLFDFEDLEPLPADFANEPDEAGSFNFGDPLLSQLQSGAFSQLLRSHDFVPALADEAADLFVGNSNEVAISEDNSETFDNSGNLSPLVPHDKLVDNPTFQPHPSEQDYILSPDTAEDLYNYQLGSSSEAMNAFQDYPDVFMTVKEKVIKDVEDDVSFGDTELYTIDTTGSSSDLQNEIKELQQFGHRSDFRSVPMNLPGRGSVSGSAFESDPTGFDLKAKPNRSGGLRQIDLRPEIQVDLHDESQVNITPNGVPIVNSSSSWTGTEGDEDTEVLRVMRGPNNQKCAKIRRRYRRTCNSLDETPSSFRCADGSRPNGKECLTELHVPAQHLCPNGHFDQEQGVCTAEAIRIPFPACPEGAVLDQAINKCVSVSVVAAKAACPNRREPVNGVCRVEVRETSPGRRNETAIARFVCPHESKEKTLANGQVVCLVRSIVPRHKYCPNGTQQIRDEECYNITPPSPAPPVVLNERPHYSCPPDYVFEPFSAGTRKREEPNDDLAVGQKEAPQICIKQSVSGPTMGCPKNSFQKSEQQCVVISKPELVDLDTRRYQPEWQCKEEGFEQHENVCILLAHQVPQLQCPAPLVEMSDGFPQKECGQFVDKIMSCPQDAQLEETAGSSSCIRRHAVPPTIIQIKICTKGDEECHIRREKRKVPGVDRSSFINSGPDDGLVTGPVERLREDYYRRNQSGGSGSLRRRRYAIDDGAVGPVNETVGMSGIVPLEMVRFAPKRVPDTF